MAERKPTFKEIIAHEKTILNPIRFHMNYRVVPLYAVFMLFTIGLSCILMAIDEVYFLPHFIAIMVLFVLGSIALVVYSRVVVKREIRDEVARYDLDYTQVPDCEEYDYSADDRILFTQDGMYINNDFYWYNHMRIRILTEMYLHRVIIHVGFLTTENGLCKIPFDARSIKMLYQFHIQIENPETLEKIRNDTYSSFETIYKKGRL